MKKYLLVLTLLTTSLSAYAVLPPDAAIIHVHDMQMINQQRFRFEQLNDYNDVQTEKIRYQKRNDRPKTLMERMFNQKSKFVDDNGEIKIEYDN